MSRVCGFPVPAGAETPECRLCHLNAHQCQAPLLVPMALKENELPWCASDTEIKLEHFLRSLRHASEYCGLVARGMLPQYGLCVGRRDDLSFRIPGNARIPVSGICACQFLYRSGEWGCTGASRPGSLPELKSNHVVLRTTS